MENNQLVVFITVPSQKIGLQIAKELVGRNLAACVNLLPGILSIYRWQGEIEQEDELLLVVKTKSSLFEKLATAVKRIHPYEVPEVIALPIVAGLKEYLAWIDVETT
jgi:periplasmic divalent cation tolerance protein